MTYWLKIYAMVTILVFFSTGAVVFTGMAVQRIAGLISRAVQPRPYVANQVSLR
jgi:hypothetical protein